MDYRTCVIDYEENKVILYNTLQSFLNDLSYITDPDIVKNSSCSLDCCFGDDVSRILEVLLSQLPHFTEKIMGISGMELLARFAEAFDDAIYLDEGPETEWVQQSNWKEFIELTSQLKQYIENSLELDQKGIVRSYKYPRKYIADFIKNGVKFIVQHNKLPDDYENDFFVRCEYILNNPDDYEGMTWSLFNLFKVLYALTQSAYVGQLNGLYKAYYNGPSRRIEELYKNGYGGRWCRDEIAGYNFVQDLQKNAVKSDDRIMWFAQLIIDEFEKQIRK